MLSDYDVQNNSTLYLFLKSKGSLLINIKLNKKIITLSVNYSDTIEILKAKVNEEEFVSLDQQIVVFAGRILQDKYTLDDYNISDGSTLHLHILHDKKEMSSTLCQLITESVEELFSKSVHQRQSQTILEQQIQEQHIQMQAHLEKLQEQHEQLKRQHEQLQEQYKQICKQNEQLQEKYERLQGQTELQQTTLQELETVSANLKLEHHIEKGQTKKLLEEVNSEKQKSDYLESTVIANLLMRIKILEDEKHISQNALLERLKGLEDTVERLWAISRDEVLLSNNILGTGGWGYVTEATYRGRRVAAKCLHEAIVSPHNQELFAKEMKISARCRHHNLVEFIGAVPDHPAIIVIELMDSTLRAALANRRATPDHIHPISMDVAQGSLYLHSIQPHPLIHRDVSAPNVLLKPVRNGWIAKLSDLGSAQFAHLAQTLGPGCIIYAAPEVQQKDTAHQQTVKMDVYSFGILLIEILTREMPLEVLKL